MTTATTRYSITVPMQANDGGHIGGVHEYVRNVLGQSFGGYTELDGTGGWFAGAQPAREPVRVYMVDTPRAFAPHLFRDLAAYVRDTAAQDAVYVTAQPILTELI